jgi:hypothetical protein
MPEDLDDRSLVVAALETWLATPPDNGLSGAAWNQIKLRR